VIWRYRVERIEASTVTKQFKRTFCEARLNELGKAVRFCLRERTVTPFRLVMGLINVLSTPKVETIADVQRAFNALCETDVQYKPFHNQLSKSQFPILMREVCCRVLDELACDVLQFGPDSPFAQFKHITIQDGTSYAIKPSLKGVWPGRFTATNPAAVELHVSLDLLTEMVNFATLTPDTEAEGQHLPAAQDVAEGLLIADRGYFKKEYLKDVDGASGSFIFRGKANMNPTVRHAYRKDGSEIKAWGDKQLKELKRSLRRYECVDMDVEYRCGPEKEKLCCRLIVSTRPNDATPRYLVSNLAREQFSVAQISDAYRLRWQIELLFKEWKSYSNVHAFDTSKEGIVEGFIWASLCAATLKRYWAHVTQRLRHVAISTRKVAMCVHHVLHDILRAMIHQPRRLNEATTRAIDYLSRNAKRAHPKRDERTGRQKLGLVHVYGLA